MKNKKEVKFKLIIKKVRDANIGDLYLAKISGYGYFRIVVAKRYTWLHHHLKEVEVRLLHDLENNANHDLVFSGEELDDELLCIGERR